MSPGGVAGGHDEGNVDAPDDGAEAVVVVVVAADDNNDGDDVDETAGAAAVVDADGVRSKGPPANTGDKGWSNSGALTSCGDVTREFGLSLCPEEDDDDDDADDEDIKEEDDEVVERSGRIFACFFPRRGWPLRESRGLSG